MVFAGSPMVIENITPAEAIPMARDVDCTGYPVGNFGIAGEVSPCGRIFRSVLYNPPVLGSWLEELGHGQFSFSCGGVRLADHEFEHKEVKRLYPEASASYSDARIDNIEIDADLLAPIKDGGDGYECSLPVLCADFHITNRSTRERRIILEFAFDREVGVGDISLINTGGFWLVGDNEVKIGFDSAICWRCQDSGIVVTAARFIPAGECAHVRFIFACHNSNGYYALRCSSMGALVEEISERWAQLYDLRRQFVSVLPRTHDDQVNRYLRWYLTAGILLTRMTRDSVLTMGYAELNQRDSFWTSWPHLVLWPELERRMIEESAEHQRQDGKIPTTILPVIERSDDIDINEYFNLRIARYYEWTFDRDFLRQMWPHVKSSIEYLKSMDKDGDGYLDQQSYWGDWKDVRGVQGRKAAPHFELLWLTVLKYAKEYAIILDDSIALQEYSIMYSRAYEQFNAHTNCGGLWNGKFYTSLWYDGRNDKHVQEDQFVGPLYEVIPSDRIASIYEALAENMAEWGVRDTYPYRENFSHGPGEYHNGGVWVFLNFADALTRFVTGYPDSGYEILRRVGKWDLEQWGDYLPAEYLNGNTGENAGKAIQAWDADYYAAIHFGALGVKMLSRNIVQIYPRISDTSEFETPIVLPGGLLWIRQKCTPESLQIELTSNLSERIEIRYGAMTHKVADGGRVGRIGECEFSVVDVSMSYGEVITLIYR